MISVNNRFYKLLFVTAARSRPMFCKVVSGRVSDDKILAESGLGQVKLLNCIAPKEALNVIFSLIADHRTPQHSSLRIWQGTNGGGPSNKGQLCRVFPFIIYRPGCSYNIISLSFRCIFPDNLPPIDGRFSSSAAWSKLFLKLHTTSDQFLCGLNDGTVLMYSGGGKDISRRTQLAALVSLLRREQEKPVVVAEESAVEIQILGTKGSVSVARTAIDQLPPEKSNELAVLISWMHEWS